MVPSRENKRESAYKTISEVAEILAIPQHVLRFWESKFPEIQPMKRNGGRRFYRPEDILLLQRIKTLLYDQGFTINGARQNIQQANQTLLEKITSPVILPPIISATKPLDNNALQSMNDRQLEDLLQELREMQKLLQRNI